MPQKQRRGFFGRRRRRSSSGSESSPKTETKSTQATNQQPIYVQQQQQPPVYQPNELNRAQPYEYAYYEPATRQQTAPVQPYQYLEVDSSSNNLSNIKPATNKPVLVLPAPVYTTIY